VSDSGDLAELMQGLSYSRADSDKGSLGSTGGQMRHSAVCSIPRELLRHEIGM
jgi:hypothetical protein